MAEVPAKNAPNLAGWVIGAGAGAVAFGLSRVIADWPWASSLFVGAVLFLVVGVILGLMGGDPTPPLSAPAPANVLPPGPGKAAASVPAAAPAEAVTASAPAALRKPESLSAARGGKADDLKIIKGIGPKLEELCHRLGFFHFDQVAGWTAEEVAWVDENLEGFKGRVTRDRWVPQAQAIMALGADEFLRQVEAGKEF